MYTKPDAQLLFPCQHLFDRNQDAGLRPYDQTFFLCTFVWVHKNSKTKR
ncbi:MAG TPA: hypothetical protein VK133_01275 [Amoebophilaceae bacterium]|nr:hypothetical protein [Amoebophilaceae bacterium]